jgi:hypothetical protein
MKLQTLLLALLSAMTFSVARAQGANSGGDISKLTAGAAIPLPNANIDIIRMQSIPAMQKLVRPGNLPGVFVIVPDENNPNISAELTLAKRLSLEVGTAGRVALIDQKQHAEIHIKEICDPLPIVGSEVTAKNWAVFFDMSNVQTLTPANSYVLTL